MSVSEKNILGPRKSSRTVVTSKSSRTSKSVRSDLSDSASGQQLILTSKGRSLTSVTPQRAFPTKASLKQKGFNAVVRNEPLFKPDMPVSSWKSVPGSSRPETPKVGPTATAQ